MKIEIPEFLSHLKVERGFPVPFFVAYVKGKADFRMTDPRKYNHCLNQNLCFICGKKHINGEYYFITGPQGLANRVHSDCPSHKRCAEYSLKVCPHLFYERAQRNEHGDYYKQAAATTGSAGIKEKPDEFFLIKADKYVSIPGPMGGILIQFRVKKFETYKYQDGTLNKIL